MEKENKNKKRNIWKYGIGFAMMCVLFAPLLAFMPTGAPDMEQGVKYKGHVKVFVNGEQVEDIWNTLTEGEEFIETVLTDGSEARHLDTLALGEGPTPVTGDKAFSGQINDSGLTKTTSLSSVDKGDGNFSISHQWTATATKTVNITAIFAGNNIATANDYFAGAAFTNPRTLYNGDKINVTWQISVS